MHLIASVITFLSLIACTFANPIFPISITTLFSHPAPTTLQTYAKPTHTHEVLHSFTHTMTRPTSTHHRSVYSHHSVYPKPTTSPAVYGRDETEADKHCLHIQCAPHFCICVQWGGDASVEPVVDYVDDTSVTGRDEGFASLALAGRDGATTDSGCNWACFQEACECIPNAGGKSAILSKTLLGLAMVGGAFAVAGLV